MDEKEKKELDKFVKFFIYKTTQTIVQARLGERLKNKAKSKEHTGTEWFNLAIPDIQEVQIEAKKALHGKSPIPIEPVCIEISLKTSESEWMILETWCVEWNAEVTEDIKVCYAVYNRLTVLLKSVQCITRSMPAFRLSRQQSADSYVMCYRIYVGSPELEHLGDNYKTRKLGEVPTPSGALSVTIAFRNRLLMIPGVESGENGGLEIKEDHYDDKADNSPPELADPPIMGPRRLSGARQCILRQNSIEARGAPEEDLCNPILFSTSPPDNDDPIDDRGELVVSPSRLGAFADANDASLSRPSSGGSLAPSEADGIIPDTPFPAMFHLSLDESEDESGRASAADGAIRSSPLLSASPRRRLNETGPAEDPEFVLVELRPPFAAPDAACDVGTFYRDCQNAPQLACFNEGANLEATFRDIADQLTFYDEAQHDLDKFVAALPDSDDEPEPAIQTEPENLGHDPDLI